MRDSQPHTTVEPGLELRSADSQTIWADRNGQFALSDGSLGNPGCDECGQEDAVVRHEGRYLCATAANALGVVNPQRAGVQRQGSILLSPEVDIDELFEQAGEGTLPSGCNSWKLADTCGWTVAHEAAHFGHLPADFDQWDLADKDGWTVAHEAASSGHLPSGFNRWELADKWHWTVADEAGKHGHLPLNFDCWESLLSPNDAMRAKHRSLGDVLSDANIPVDRYEEAMNIAAAGGWDSMGVRSDFEYFTVGTMLEPSVDYDDGEPTDWVLDGTCTTGIYRGYEPDRPMCVFPKALIINKLYYPWTHTYLVGGAGGTLGADNDELIIANAVVLYELSDVAR